MINLAKRIDTINISNAINITKHLLNLKASISFPINSNLEYIGLLLLILI